MANRNWKRDITRLVEKATGFTAPVGGSEKAYFSFELKDWEFAKKLENFPPLGNLDAGTITQLSNDHRRVNDMVQLSQALAASASELLEFYSCRLEHVSLTLSKCLASLPDELLALILKFATLHEEDKTTSALWLSHVSRRFRGIMLGDQNLWSTLSLHHLASKECLRTFIRRSGDDIDLHPVFKFNNKFNFAEFRGLLDVCTPHSCRWRTLAVVGDWESGNGSVGRNAIINVELGLLMDIYHLTLPRLQELILRENRVNLQFDIPVWNTSDSTFTNVPSWETPGLISLRCIQYIPPPTLPFTSFTSFDLTLKLLPSAIERQLEELVTFLSSEQKLSRLLFQLEDYDGIASNATTRYNVPTAACPAVTSFDMSVSNLDVGGVVSLVVPIVNAFQMPNLENFSLSLEIRSLHNVKKFTSLPSMLLPDLIRHRCLKSVTIDMRIREQPKETTALKLKLGSFDIPLFKIIHIPHLCVTLPGSFAFSDRPPSRGHTIPLPSLRELEFRSCKDLDIKCLQSVVRSLKATLVWKVIDHITIRRCPMLDYDEVLAIVGKRRLVFIK